eukprot:1003201-Pelagomonas_calceolata.AAC.1
MQGLHFRQRTLSLHQCKEKGTYWFKRAVGLLHQKSEIERASGDLDGNLKHLAPEPGCEKYSVFNGVLYRICMEFTCKLASPLVVEAYSFLVHYNKSHQHPEGWYIM